MVGAIRLERPSDVGVFDRAATAFLLEREAENCVMLGLCSQMHGGGLSIQSVMPYFAVARRGDEVVGAVLVAGHLILLSTPLDSEAIPLLVEDIAREMPAVPGVVAQVDMSRRFAEAWTEHTGRAHRLNMSERIFQLDRVIPSRPVAGEMRIADPGDRLVLAQWLQEFNLEALGQTIDRAAMEAFADRWIARQGRAMYLWIDGKRVSMVGASGETPNGIRIAPAYTPRELRGRGYASALTAAVSQAQLDSGKRSCFLYTDLANPTSNHIYQAIGYRPVSDAADHRFDPPPG